MGTRKPLPVMKLTIRIAENADIITLASLIRDSFRSVADRFNLTSENAPMHPSNCKPEWIESGFKKGVRYYLLETDEGPIGCVALEQAGPDVCYLERLAVFPEFRERGFGRALVRHVEAEAEKLGARSLEIAIIWEQGELREWYESLGFRRTHTRRFEHLPFLVGFMRKELSTGK